MVGDEAGEKLCTVLYKFTVSLMTLQYIIFLLYQDNDCVNMPICQLDEEFYHIKLNYGRAVEM